MRTTLIRLLAATALSTTLAASAFAQGSPFGPPSAPLTAEEIHAIKEEGAAIKREREAAARRIAEKREAAAAAREAQAARAAEAEAAAAAASMPIEATSPAADAAYAPTPEGAAMSGTTVIPNAVVDPASPTGISAAPMPEPMPTPEPELIVIPSEPVQMPAATVPPGGFPAPMDDSGIPPLPTGE